MNINSKLKKLCSDSFKVDLIDVTNESYLHNTSVNSESHFKLILVSNDFIGLKIIDRH
ncbi:BolA/IbaG family iron-sulfur metabolism protein, partial [Gammaproteobacteria bacterium]|nr:BolA/IbaG family iron-sulfur metabolism protein [Gammaproteobacteria bacterium]